MSVKLASLGDNDDDGGGQKKRRTGKLGEEGEEGIEKGAYKSGG